MLRKGLCGVALVLVSLVTLPARQGTIVEPGNATSLRKGQLVAINPYLACGDCIACRKNKPNACVKIRVLGVHTDGGMCDLLAVPESAAMLCHEAPPLTLLTAPAPNVPA